MQVIVLGAGLQGRAAAYDLLRGDGIRRVILADGHASALHEAERSLRSSGSAAGVDLELRRLELGPDSDLASLLGGLDGCFSALPYFLNQPVAETCARLGVHYVDLGGNTAIVHRILELDATARAAGASLVPDCGLAPGLVATAAMALLEDLNDVERLELRVGGLPQNPCPPLRYHLSFSVHGLINEYLGEAVALRDGEIVHLPTLDDVEDIEFPAPVGACEAFSTHGGSSTLPWSLASRVRHFDYKTVRYPGHAEKIRLLRDLGFFAERALSLPGAALKPRECSEAVLAESLAAGDELDLVVFRVSATGSHSGRRMERHLEMIDFFDEVTGLSAMQRCTAFPASEVLQTLLRAEGAGPGAHPLEKALDPTVHLEALRRRGLALEFREVEIGDVGR